ncbi:hypothetical protein BX611_2677 [Lutibacter oceani]|uniref:Uncharacterized protein n=1 Tax=Lutibacter oceani TaxID=1853311 RepID=A0A3D9RQ28_9FLAO|nr:hypothetical protein [Lutibacter oceani]REE79781.1 hypothetical protein BX611_2677 [Lutibacter oceani]
MKTLKLFLLCICVISISCKEEKPKKEIKSKVAVKHYICQNKCENSGSDSEDVCPTCNTAYLHNQAFHNDDFLKNGPLKVPDNTQTNTQNTTTPAPAQNASGVYHYTCTNGCVGGSGTAANCNSCGNPLAHNQAYHNN